MRKSFWNGSESSEKEYFGLCSNLNGKAFEEICSKKNSEKMYLKANFSVLLFVLFFIITCCNKNGYYDSKSMLSFEIIENGMPKDWSIHQQSGYLVSLDAIYLKSNNDRQRNKILIK
jgi:hypothetical protein